ncbi:hypothetical protein KEJ19_08160 [Candidatus Bathyarchaeota archaeon]|nr:hypothetical protein [Candidatus Bathyarchaeota archaeon]
MPINMAHTIGTLALLGMLIIVSVSFAMVTSSIQAEVTKEQLSAVGEYIALHIVEMATLVDTSNLKFSGWTGKPLVMVRNITLPPDIQGKIYIIQLVHTPSGQYFVRLSMLTRPDISVNVSIPLSSRGSNVNLSLKVLPSLNIEEWIPQDRLYSGDKFAVFSTSDVAMKKIQFCVWGYRNDSLYVGLAKWKDGG